MDTYLIVNKQNFQILKGDENFQLSNSFEGVTEFKNHSDAIGFVEKNKIDAAVISKSEYETLIKFRIKFLENSFTKIIFISLILFALCVVADFLKRNVVDSAVISILISAVSGFIYIGCGYFIIRNLLKKKEIKNQLRELNYFTRKKKVMNYAKIFAVIAAFLVTVTLNQKIDIFDKLSLSTHRAEELRNLCKKNNIDISKYDNDGVISLREAKEITKLSPKLSSFIDL